MLKVNCEPIIVSSEEIIEEARNGRMFILVDDEDRENEGDLVIPAQMATPAAINFMARHGRGLICLALSGARVRELGLPPMSAMNSTRHQTAFTVSIEARDGVTTGISARDRSRTITAAIEATNGPDQIVTPGHVFPLAARDGGVLVRAGHTEAAVDVSRLAGLNPSGVICEIINDDGTMARLEDLVGFAREHDLKIGTIRDLIAYRRRHDHLVTCVTDEPFSSDYGGDWRLLTYRNKVDGSVNYVLRKGVVDPNTPSLVRVHVASIFADMLGEPGPRKRALQRAMVQIGEVGAGFIVLIVQPPGQEVTSGASQGSRGPMDPRNYGIGAQILSDLGVHDMILLSNSPQRTIIGLEAYGIKILGQQPLREA